MRTLSKADFLALWERGRTLHPLDRGLLAICAAFPEMQQDTVADWPLGRRNRALIELRDASFGTALRGWTACQKCEEKLEFTVDGRALIETAPAEHGETISVKGRAFRLPTSRDLAHIVGDLDPESAATRLLEQCAVEPPVQAPMSEWTDDDINAVGERMALADPLAEIMLHFDCPTCGGSFDEALDLPAFLWSEIEAHAKRLLIEVHELATAYGWSETQILSLSEARREFYLAMVRG